MFDRRSLPLLGALPLAVLGQLTYSGHPLYTFVNDKKAGDTTGEAINGFGGSWFAVSPAGAKVAPRSQPQGGGGYGGY
jgi:hypothetical protein